MGLTVYPHELTREKSLFQIYKKYAAIKKPKFNYIVTLLFFLVISGYTIFTKSSNVILAEQTRQFIDFSFSFSSSTLGFLVAGYAIWATLTNQKSLLVMAATKKPGSDISYLKYGHFSLIYVFIHFIVFTVLCGILKIMACKQCLIPDLLFSIRTVCVDLVGIFIRATHIIVSTYFIFLLFQIKSFIFNLFYLVMVSVRLNYELRDDDIDELLQQRKQ